jgi:hypothetical protein
MKRRLPKSMPADFVLYDPLAVGIMTDKTQQRLNELERYARI